MYIIPLVVFILLGIIAVAWTPIFAIPIFILFMIGFFAYVGMRPRADEKPEALNQPGATPHTEESGGIWGEKRPE
jgi:hypothetical protein